jgi:hypothetical protein
MKSTYIYQKSEPALCSKLFHFAIINIMLFTPSFFSFLLFLLPHVSKGQIYCTFPFMILTPALSTLYQANSSNESLKWVQHCYLLQFAAENWTLWKVGQIYLKSSDMWCLGNDGEYRVHRCCEREVLRKSQGGEEYPK